MATRRLDRQLYSDAVDIYYKAFEPAQHVKDVQVNLHMSPITANAVKLTAERGGMAAGWAEEDQLFFNIEMVWSQASNNKLMLSITRDCINKVRELAAKRALLMPTIWINNAQPDDNVLASYGETNYAKIRQVSQKYDPKRTLQDLCSGAYKLGKF